jgi:hypothetical protein
VVHEMWRVRQVTKLRSRIVGSNVRESSYHGRAVDSAGAVLCLRVLRGAIPTEDIEKPAEGRYLLSVFRRNGLTAPTLVLSILTGFVLLAIRIGFEIFAASPIGKQEFFEALIISGVLVASTLLALLLLWVNALAGHRGAWNMRRFVSYYYLPMFSIYGSSAVYESVIRLVTNARHLLVG